MPRPAVMSTRTNPIRGVAADQGRSALDRLGVPPGAQIDERRVRGCGGRRWRTETWIGGWTRTCEAGRRLGAGWPPNGADRRDDGPRRGPRPSRYHQTGRQRRASSRCSRTPLAAARHRAPPAQPGSVTSRGPSSRPPARPARRRRRDASPRTSCPATTDADDPRARGDARRPRRRAGSPDGWSAVTAPTACSGAVPDAQAVGPRSWPGSPRQSRDSRVGVVGAHHAAGGAGGTGTPERRPRARRRTPRGGPGECATAAPVIPAPTTTTSAPAGSRRAFVPPSAHCRPLVGQRRQRLPDSGAGGVHRVPEGRKVQWASRTGCAGQAQPVPDLLGQAGA